MKYQFVRDCVQICPDEKKLCNILIDLCYKKNGTKKLSEKDTENKEHIKKMEE